MKPFVLIDVDTMEIILVIKNIVKRIQISKLDSAEDFIDEFYRRFKEVNFVSKYNVINRKEFMDLITGLHESKEKEEAPQTPINRPAPASSRGNQSADEEEEEDNFENSTLIRANTERKIAIEDLNMRFDEPYDYYDLAVFDQEKIKKSTHLNHFLQKGILVKTSMDEISKIRKSTISEKEREKKERQESLIVERNKDDDEMLISSEAYRAADANMNMNINPMTANVVPDSEGAQAVLEMFSSNTDSALGAESARSMDDLLRRT